MATTVNIASLVDAGVHFGHQTRKWSPKMEPYIFTARGGIHIIDLKQTLIELDKAYSFASDLAAKGGRLLFVGTKKQAQEPIASCAERCGMPYVNNRWLGGMLTNFVTIRSRVSYMEELEAMVEDGRMATLPKKEQILLQKELVKLQANLNGVRDMIAVPQALFVIDTKREEIAIHEAHRLKIPVIGILDTNADPDEVEYGIPANDDAIRSVGLITNVIADAIIAGATNAMLTEAELIDSPSVAAPASQVSPAPSASPAPPAPVNGEREAAPAAQDSVTLPAAEATAEADNGWVPLTKTSLAEADSVETDSTEAATTDTDSAEAAPPDTNPAEAAPSEVSPAGTTPEDTTPE
jgi:small subunit ribosomal protein S2